MNNDKLTVDESVLIGRNYWDVPVRVELPAYLRFGRRMDSQLRRLVARWLHAAAPDARGLRQSPREVGARHRRPGGRPR
jgi:hypothetical protein